MTRWAPRQGPRGPGLFHAAGILPGTGQTIQPCTFDQRRLCLVYVFRLALPFTEAIFLQGTSVREAQCPGLIAGAVDGIQIYEVGRVFSIIGKFQVCLIVRFSFITYFISNHQTYRILI